MSADVAKAAINEALELSYAFRQNAALKNGLPDCQKNRIENLTVPKQEPPIVNITNQIPAAPAATDTPSPGATVAATVKGSLLRRAAPWLLGAVAPFAGAALGYMLGDKDKTPVIQQNPDGSLLQYLEDNGQHLSEPDQWQTK